MSFQNQKLKRIIACPNCKSALLNIDQEKINCKECGELYDIINDKPVLINNDSPVLKWFELKKESTSSEKRRYSELFRALYSRLRPEDRVWTNSSQKAMQELLEINNPDADDANVVLIGSGLESVFRRILTPYKNIIRIGLTNQENMDLLSDICDIPLRKDSINLILSSSVLEHVYDPEKAVKEIFRVVKPGGYVYAEIPFMRAYHMAPVDYQRYTISGIEELFKRNGFTLVNKGICSGPFTALALFLVDLCGSLFSFNWCIKEILMPILSLIVHPLKYLDRLFEKSTWAEISACNFYYIGKKE